jgi:hypothetical protein
MDSETCKIEILEARIRRLESQGRRMKRAGMFLLVLIGALAGMGQVKQKNRLVEGEKFVLKDISGTKRAELLMEAGGPGLVLYDPDGNRIGRFGGTGEGHGAGLSLQGARGESKVTLISLADGPHLLMFDARGKFRSELGATVKGPYLFLHDDNERVRAALAVEGDAPKLQVSDSEGYTAVLGTNALITTKTNEVQKTSAASLLLYGKQKEVIWRAP